MQSFSSKTFENKFTKVFYLLYKLSENKLISKKQKMILKDHAIKNNP